MALNDHLKPSENVPGCSEITDIKGFVAELGKILEPRFAEEEARWAEHGPAAEARLAEMGVALDTFGGNCPVQAEGDVDGKRFYFRARGDEWQFHVADDDSLIFDTPIFYIERDYGGGPFDAGWMPKHEALGFIAEAVAEFRAQGMVALPETGADTGSAAKRDQPGPATQDAPNPSPKDSS